MRGFPCALQNRIPGGILQNKPICVRQGGPSDDWGKSGGRSDEERPGGIFWYTGKK